MNSVYKKLGVIAGAGVLPFTLAKEARENGAEVFVAKLQGGGDSKHRSNTPQLRDVASIYREFSVAKVGHILSFFRRHDVDMAVLAGAFVRPSFLHLIPDMRGFRLISRLLRLKERGDDAVLRTIISFIEESGFKVIGAHDIVKNLLIPQGVMTVYSPDKTACADIELGAKVARELGRLDIGQAVVAQQGQIIAVEAVEGTDALIKRYSEISLKGPAGVLVKVKKPQQDERADLPTIGASTVRICHQAGLRGIAAEAGAALFVEQEEALELARRYKMFIVGI